MRKSAQLAIVGSWADDPYLEELLKDIYRKRGRSMVEEGKILLDTESLAGASG